MVLMLAASLSFVTSSAKAQFDRITRAQWGSLEHGNGDQLAIDRLNNLHVAYADGGFIKYVTSSDGDQWTVPSLVSSPASLSAMPAITVDSAGTIAIVYVGQYDPLTEMGRIYFAFKPLNGATWNVSEIVTLGTQPDIVSHGHDVHITWTTFDSVHYLSFATQVPPSTPVLFGEEIDGDTCAGHRFLRPSIALELVPCGAPIPRVAYLVEFDETNSMDPTCASLITEVGPRVCERDPASGTWAVEWSDTLTAINPVNGVEAVSLSLNSNARDKHFFLAYSDVSDGSARTRIAHGIDGVWDSVAHDSYKNHVHVQAKPASVSGGFRFAWVEEGIPGLPFVDPSASHRSGTWPSGPAPTWSDPTSVQIAQQRFIGRPQASWWGRCLTSGHDRIRALFEADGACSLISLATDLETGLSCPPMEPPVAFSSCQTFRELRTARVNTWQVVDTRDLGAIVELGPSYAVYDVGGGGVAVVSWSAGVVAAAWQDGFALEGFEGEITVEGAGQPTVFDYGHLSQYDGPFETCLGDGHIFSDGFESGDTSAWDLLADGP
ncbi:MAG: hypothetical protein AAGM22_26080 [Acidobacteriota bacterium]